MFCLGIGVLIALHIAVFARMWREAKRKRQAPLKPAQSNEQKNS